MSSEGSETGKEKRVGARAAIALAAVAAGFVVYALLFHAAKPQGAALGSEIGRFAHGRLAALQALSPPPPQTQEPFLDPQGRMRTLADYRGEIVMLNLWATWCTPCQAEMPTIAALQRRFPEGFRIIAVSVDKPPDDVKARAMLAELSGGALAFYSDPTARIQFTIGSPGLPATLLYDREGREIARLIGPAEWDGPEAEALIAASLN